MSRRAGETLLGFVLYPLAIAVVCFLLTAIGNVLGSIFDSVGRY